MIIFTISTYIYFSKEYVFFKSKIDFRQSVM